MTTFKEAVERLFLRVRDAAGQDDNYDAENWTLSDNEIDQALISLFELLENEIVACKPLPRNKDDDDYSRGYYDGAFSSVGMMLQKLKGREMSDFERCPVCDTLTGQLKSHLVREHGWR